MSVFVDTSALMAGLIPEDEHHEEARSLWQRLIAEHEELVTTNYVVLETCALMHRRFGPNAVSRLLSLLSIVQVQWVDVSLHETGVAASLLSARRGPSVVDCVSFAVMHKLGITKAFAFDPHFAAQGFESAT